MRTTYPYAHNLSACAQGRWHLCVGAVACEGILDEDEDLGLVVASETLVLFGDGIESDRLTLTWGQSVRISRAPRALSLVDPAGLGEG